MTETSKRDPKDAISPDRIRAVRLALDVNQGEFGALFGVHPITVSKWENGRAAPDPHQEALLEIAELAAKYEPDVGDRVAKKLSEGAVWSAIGELQRAAAAPEWTPRALAITAGDLSRWADTHSAQDHLPTLVRRLVLATAPHAELVEFAAGDATTTGYDGRTISRTPLWPIPGGKAVWELSSSGEVRNKANRDIKKRAESPQLPNPGEVTYIAVNLRPWDSRKKSIDSWETKWTSNSPFSSVRFYDGNILETWIGRCPAVAVWLAGALGRPIDHCYSTEALLEEMLMGGARPLGPKVLMAGRDEETTAVRRWLSGPPSSLQIQADSSDEALAFVSAVVATSDEEDRVRWQARGLVIDDPGVWRRVIGEYDGVPLLLLPRFPETDRASLGVVAGHYVVVPAERFDTTVDGAVDLRPLSQGPLSEALQENPTNLPEEGAPSTPSAKRVAREAEGSFAALRIGMGIPSSKPEWITEHKGDAMLAMLLTGAWTTDNSADREIIGNIVGTNADEVEHLCSILARVRNPPIRHRGGVWLWRSRRDTWPVVAPHLSPGMAVYQRFLEACKTVLGYDDPALEMKSEDRWMAPVHEAVIPHSEALRQGLCESLVLLSLIGSGPGQLQPQNVHVDCIVRDILAPEWKRWASLDDVLVHLAEASPERFMDRINDSLAIGEEGLIQLFSQGGEPMMGPMYFPALLWALEGLAWSPARMTRVVSILSRLSDRIQETKTGNSPKGSLCSIFRWWLPQTSASVDDRKSALDVVKRASATVWWSLLLDLLPSPHMIGMPSHQFRWREAGEHRARRAPPSEAHEFIETVCGMLVENCDSAIRFRSLLENIERLHKEHRVRFLQTLEDHAEQLDDSKAISELLNTSRKALHNSRSYSGERSLTKEHEEILEKVIGSLNPHDLGLKHAWLFTQHVELPEGVPEDYDEWEKRVDEMRVEVLQEVFASSDPQHNLEKLIQSSKMPGIVAWTAGRVGAPETLESHLIRVDCGEESENQVTRMYARGVQTRLGTDGLRWLREQAVTLLKEGRDRTAVEILLSDPKPGVELWDWIDQLDQRIRDDYWRKLPSYPMLVRLPGKPVVEHAIRRLLAVGRGLDSCEAAFWGIWRKDISDQPDGRLIAEALRSAHEELFADGDLRRDISNLAHHIVELMDSIQNSEELSSDEKFNLELIYFSLLENRRPPVQIHMRLETDPSLVVEFLCILYRADAEAESTETDAALSDEEKQKKANLATIAYRILESWKGVPGGLNEENHPNDEPHLRSWIREVRRGARSAGRLVTTDLFIGKVLARSGIGQDGAWPCDIAREEFIEDGGLVEVKRGMMTARTNARGVWTKSLTEGGRQERDIAQRYRDDAAVVARAFPETAAMLRQMAEKYELDARRMDRESARWIDP